VVLAFAGRATSFVPKGDYALVGRLGGYYSMNNFARCDHLVCDAPSVVRHVLNHGWSEHRITLIPNFPLIEEGEPVDRASLDTPNGVPLALSLGRLHPNKAHDMLLRAAALVPDLWVWIAGEGEDRATLQSLARELGVDSRVKFLGWRNDRAGLFKAADLCVYPSRAEPFGNVVLEAWAYGVPLVTTASEGPAWLTRKGEDALVTPIDDAQAFADAIRSLLASKPLAAHLIAGGRKRADNDFSEAAIVRRYVDMFEALLKNRAR
jgi:glycosyltransferase involved in cell wall biosynthesis